VSAPSLGSRLRELRESLGLTQDEVSLRSVDEDGRILRRIEVGHVESGRNRASTRRVRTSLARAFGAAEEEMFDYLEGRTSLPDFLEHRGKVRRPVPRDHDKSARERAIELVVADGYGTAVEVRQAAATARDALPSAEADALGVLEWANLIEGTLRKLRRANDSAAPFRRASPGGLAKGARSAKTEGKRNA